MSCEAGITAGLKGQLSKFSGIISKGLNKPKQRLIHEMIYGIQAAKDVKLSNISRTLKEDRALIKTEDRLSRNLDDCDFTDGINDEICRLAANKITDEMVILGYPLNRPQGIVVSRSYHRWLAVSVLHFVPNDKTVFPLMRTYDD